MSGDTPSGEEGRAALQAQVEAALDGPVRQVIEAHGGGVIAIATSPNEVRVEFMGRCAACPSAPITMASVVRPALMEIEGVDSVSRAGRTSRFAEERIARLFG